MILGESRAPTFSIYECYLLQHLFDRVKHILYLKGQLHLNYSQKAPYEDSAILLYDIK